MHGGPNVWYPRKKGVTKDGGSGYAMPMLAIQFVRIIGNAPLEIGVRFQVSNQILLWAGLYIKAGPQLYITKP